MERDRAPTGLKKLATRVPPRWKTYEKPLQVRKPGKYAVLTKTVPLPRRGEALASLERQAAVAEATDQVPDGFAFVRAMEEEADSFESAALASDEAVAAAAGSVQPTRARRPLSHSPPHPISELLSPQLLSRPRPRAPALAPPLVPSGQFPRA